MQATGAVFMPAAGYRSGTRVNYASSNGYYWSSTENTETKETYDLNFRSNYFRPQGSDARSSGFSVRLVWDIPFTISVLTEGEGSVTGADEYKDGSVATLTATPNEEHAFTKWTDGNTDNPRQIRVTKNATYTAVFAPVLSGVIMQENENDDYYTQFALDYNNKIVKTATLNRQFVKGKWEMICLPFDVNKNQMKSTGLYGRVFQFHHAKQEVTELQDTNH